MMHQASHTLTKKIPLKVLTRLQVWVKLSSTQVMRILTSLLSTRIKMVILKWHTAYMTRKRMLLVEIRLLRPVPSNNKLRRRARRVAKAVSLTETLTRFSAETLMSSWKILSGTLNHLNRCLTCLRALLRVHTMRSDSRLWNKFIFNALNQLCKKVKEEQIKEVKLKVVHDTRVIQEARTMDQRDLLEVLFNILLRRLRKSNLK